ncbi:DUF1127 domain-containing protein [Methylobacterium marchantiae]|uniref:DUF1127 domain-containing protein n=1 Tax=Methylobacterium marchantiae TaxID=600331 RepID=A0ABW3X129_9HYPH|nr:hypothetical protein AIGOOFII_3994 [Methylobacterium marchantiae]
MTPIVHRQTVHRTLTPFPTGPLAKVSTALRRLLAQIASGLSRQAINRRVVRKLAVMSDRELKDIGLVRQDVEDAGSGVGDASLLLLARRDERRGARAS